MVRVPLRFPVIVRNVAFALLLLALFPLHAAAQPAFTFKRVTVNWPTLELYFAAGCNGVPAYDMTKDNFRIFENGEEITDFTLWCPDPHIRCTSSTVMVADVSGSMAGVPLERMQLYMHGWVDILDGVLDEAAIITAGRQPKIHVPMTTNTFHLNNGIDSLRASGGSALLDGIREAILHLIDAGVNQCRAVVVFTDGGDNLSSTDAASIISLANRNRIRVFTVGVGEMFDEARLEMIALLTGGRYYRSPNAGQLVAIYQEFTTIIFPGWQECVITYERDCPQGDMRTVEMRLVDYCGGAESKTKTYRAPLDSSQFGHTRFRIAENGSEPSPMTTVPVFLETMPGDSILAPFRLTIGFPPDMPASFRDVQVPAGGILSAAPLQIRQYADSVSIALPVSTPVDTTGVLFSLRFFTAGIFDSVRIPIMPIRAETEERCHALDVRPGAIHIVPRLLPLVTPEGYVTLCAGQSVLLESMPGFAAYSWSNGARSKDILVSEPGTYVLTVVDSRGDTLTSKPVFVDVLPGRKVHLEADGELEFCLGQRRRLSVAGDTEGTVVRWMDRSYQSAPIYDVTRSGEYWAVLIDSVGCRTYTDTVTANVARQSIPFTENIDGDTLWLCPGEDQHILSVADGFREYRWYPTYERTPSIMISPRDMPYWVRTEDSSGCEGESRRMYVARRAEALPVISPAEHVVLCRGSELRLELATEFQSCLWSTGDTTRSIPVDSAGVYEVTVTYASGCTATVSSTVEIVDQPEVEITALFGHALCTYEHVVLDAGAGYERYRWSTGESTQKIEVDVPGPYAVEVTAFGSCSAKSDTLWLREDQPSARMLTVHGDTAFCPGDSVMITAPDGFAVYRWNTGDSARSILARNPGRYRAVLLTDGGCEFLSEAVALTWKPEVPPTITRSGNLLTSSEALSYQWFYYGREIDDATSRGLSITRTGSYHVVVLDSCGRYLSSDTLQVTTTGVPAVAGDFALRLYPMPVRDVLQVRISDLREGEVSIQVEDLLGRRLKALQRMSDRGVLSAEVDMRTLPRGIYVLRITAGERVRVEKILRF